MAKRKKCRHKWLKKFVEGKNALKELALWEVWYCKKCKIQTKGSFRGIIKSNKKTAELKKRITPREERDG